MVGILASRQLPPFNDISLNKIILGMEYKEKFNKSVPVKSVKVPTKLISGYLKTLSYKDVKITPIKDDKEHVITI